MYSISSYSSSVCDISILGESDILTLGMTNQKMSDLLIPFFVYTLSDWCIFWSFIY